MVLRGVWTGESCDVCGYGDSGGFEVSDDYYLLVVLLVNLVRWMHRVFARPASIKISNNPLSTIYLQS